MAKRQCCARGLGSLLVVALPLLVGCASLRSGSASDGPFALISVLDVSRPAERTYPVVLQAIDGKRPQSAGAEGVPMMASVVVRENVSPNRYDFPVKPGQHYVHLTAVMRPTDAGGYLGVRQHSADNGLAIGLTVQEGKRYTLGAQVDGYRIDEWLPVVVAVEDIENYKRATKSTAPNEGNLKSDR